MCAGGDPARVSCASVLTAIEAALLRCSETRRARRYAALSCQRTFPGRDLVCALALGVFEKGFLLPRSLANGAVRGVFAEGVAVGHARQALGSFSHFGRRIG
jgi:hypothetical protein